jgi:large subunit ribosomal protein L3
MRTGILAKKLGMTRVYNEQRVHNSVTVLEVPEIKVIGQKKKEKDGYDALVLGVGSIKQKKIHKPQKEFFSKFNIEPVNKIKEFRVSEDNLVESGAIIVASHFVVGQYVDVKSFSIGKGFAGAMKRHNFGGLRASHGVSASHRSHGSTGNCQDPGRVFKGKKMAGHMGNVKVTKQNLRIVDIDHENNLIVIKGSVPGKKNTTLFIKDAVKGKNS